MRNLGQGASNLVQEFRKESTQKAIQDTKTATVVGSIAFPVFSVLDYFVYPQHYFEFLAIRTAVVVICMTVFGLMHTKLGKAYPKEFGVFLYIVG